MTGWDSCRCSGGSTISRWSRLRARFEWLDHLVRAYQHFDERNGGFLAAALSYYTIFALFPLLMVSFAVVGFVLSRRPDLLATIDDHIRSTVEGALGQQLVNLMDSAINARTSVGLIGLATAAWVGLSWMSRLRVAVTAMWDQGHHDSRGFLRHRLSDVIAMVGTFGVIELTVGLTAISQVRPLRAMLRWLEIHTFSVLGETVVRVVSILVSLVVSWILFTWMIGRLPRQKVDLVASMKAGLIAAIGFELFKQVASIYLRVVLRSPAGATFGPVLGLMVLSYVTAYLVLFATAWAATDPGSPTPPQDRSGPASSPGASRPDANRPAA